MVMEVYNYFRPPANASRQSEREQPLHLEDSRLLWNAMEGLMQDRAVRQEALMLLIDSLATISPQPGSAAKRAAFSSHLHDELQLSTSDKNPNFVDELLRLFCESQPAEVAEFIDRYCPQAASMVSQ